MKKKQPTAIRELFRSAPFDPSRDAIYCEKVEKAVYSSFAHDMINPSLKEERWAKLMATHGALINDRIRSGCADKEDLALQKELNKHHTTADLVLYNGTRTSLILQMIEAGADQGCDLFSAWHLYCSLASSHQHMGKDFVNLKILLPQGASCAYIGDAGYEEDLCVVLPRDIKMKIIHRVYNKNQTLLVCEVI